MPSEADHGLSSLAAAGARLILIKTADIQSGHLIGKGSGVPMNGALNSGGINAKIQFRRDHAGDTK
jgi:hypothetical protein